MGNVDIHYALADRDLVLDDTPYILRVRDLPIEEKPREKLQHIGPGGLSIAELVAIVLGVGTRKEEVMAMSRRILHEYGEKAIITENNPEKLSEILDIPASKASQLIAAIELGRRFFATSEGKPVFIRTASDAYRHVAGIGHVHKEQLRGLYLNSRYELIHDEVISVGSLTANIVHPREVFRPALNQGAVAVILAHNHPSGDSTATNADISVTAQIRAAGKILGIDLLDHIVVTKNGYESIMEGVNE